MSRNGLLTCLSLLSLTCFLLADVAAQPLPTENGYRGIWYSNQPDSTPYKFKYSGGLGTYPQQHIPIAVYSPEANKTFFCYGAAEKDANTLVYAVSYFDHATGQVPRPTRLGAKATDDAHDNPVLSLDADGYLYVFLNAHGTSRPSDVWRSTEPHAIDRFEKVLEGVNFSYAQPWFLPEHGGFVWLRTQYGGLAGGRSLFWTRSRDGETWDEPKPLAHIEEGNYQISWPKPDGATLGTAFDYHPAPTAEDVEEDDYRGLNHRSNIYYLETADFGATWTTVDGTPVETPVTEADNPALAYNSRQDDELVYLKDLAYDQDGRPVILFLDLTRLPVRSAERSAHVVHAPVGRRRLAALACYHDVRPQLRPRLALPRIGRHLAHHRADGDRTAGVQSRRRDDYVDEHGQRPDVDVQATHA